MGLPADYYTQYFDRVLNVALLRYADLLRVQDREFISRYQKLPAQAARLYVRLIGRSAQQFRVDKLSYAEVTDTRSAIADLKQAGLVSHNGYAPAEQLLNLLNRAELVAVAEALLLAQPLILESAGALSLEQAARSVPPKRLKKAELISLIQNLAADQSTELVAGISEWIQPLGRATIQRILCCFFGNQRQSMNEFVVEDVGNVHFECYRVNGTTWRSRSQLDQSLEGRRLFEEIDASLDTVTLPLYSAAVLSAVNLPLRSSRSCANAHVQLGAHFARQNNNRRALEHFRASSHGEAPIREIRLLAKQGVHDEAHRKAKLLACRGDDSQRRQATDFLQGRRKQRNHIPELGNPEVMHLAAAPAASGQSVEQASADALRGEGYAVVYSENSLPSTVFGILLWPVIFSEVAGTFPHEYRHGPVDLYSEAFCAQREEAISSLRSSIQSACGERLLSTFWYHKFNTSCALVNWQWPYPVLQAFWQSLGLDQQLGLFDYIVADPKRLRSGWPDLFCITSDGKPRFVEIKGPQDTLRPVQRERIALLHELQISCAVLEVTWQR